MGFGIFVKCSSPISRTNWKPPWMFVHGGFCCLFRICRESPNFPIIKYENGRSEMISKNHTRKPEIVMKL